METNTFFMKNSEILEGFKKKCDSLNIEYQEDENGIRAEHKKPSAEGSVRLKVVCEFDNLATMILIVEAPGIKFFGTGEHSYEEALRKLEAGKIMYNA